MDVHIKPEALLRRYDTLLAFDTHQCRPDPVELIQPFVSKAPHTWRHRPAAPNCTRAAEAAVEQLSQLNVSLDIALGPRSGRSADRSQCQQCEDQHGSAHDVTPVSRILACLRRGVEAPKSARELFAAIGLLC
jgi:hypothetical protein